MTGSTLVGVGLCALSGSALVAGLAVRSVRERWRCALGQLSVFRGPCRVSPGEPCDFCAEAALAAMPAVRRVSGMVSDAYVDEGGGGWLLLCCLPDDLPRPGSRVVVEVDRG